MLNCAESDLNKFLAENTFPILSRREAKGYCFEIEVQNILYTLGFKLQGNPVSEYAWKRSNIRHKVDIVLANGLALECKAIDGKVYLSWFKRDWLPKGNCVFVFKGDLKLSPAIIEQYHPILVHYSLLHIYLNYKHPLLCTVTSLLEAITTKNVETEKYLSKTLRLNSSSKKIPTKSMELSSSEKRLHDGSIEIEAPSKGVPIPSSSLQAKTWKLEPVGGTTHLEISESFSISITTQRGESHEL